MADDTPTNGVLETKCARDMLTKIKDNNEELLSAARFAETAERYNDMCTFMKQLVTNKTGDEKNLELEERNLLSVAYKNVIGMLRSSWRVMGESKDDEAAESASAAPYKELIKAELILVSNECLKLLDEILKVETEKKEPRVFYLKMKGDYNRYLAEIDPEEYKDKAGACYKEATEVADEGDIAATHPTRLGLALNYSVCHYEILDEKDNACAVAKTAFDKAIEKLDTLNDASYKDSTLIMQLLRDNLTLWTSEESGKGDEADAQ